MSGLVPAYLSGSAPQLSYWRLRVAWATSASPTRLARNHGPFWRSGSVRYGIVGKPPLAGWWANPR